MIVNESVDAHKRGEVADYKLATAKQAVVKAEASVVSGGWTTDDVKLLTKGEIKTLSIFVISLKFDPHF